MAAALNKGAAAFFIRQKNCFFWGAEAQTQLKANSILLKPIISSGTSPRVTPLPRAPFYSSTNIDLPFILREHYQFFYPYQLCSSPYGKGRR